MKYTQSLFKTLREAPSDAEVVSHQLLVRAGFIRKVAVGIYELLPMGLRSLRKVEAIVRDELNKAGCQEVFLPHLVPAELWQESGRWQKYGPELLRIKDRHNREYCFGPTHEEVMCDLVRSMLSSYKALPQHLYQIQTKFRDEIRPRFGLMRGREFLMKDSYSFHESFEDLDREYQKMYQVYLNIFKRSGLHCRAVDADTGAIGGSSSHEFMVLAETGEDVIAACNTCHYAANIEKANRRLTMNATKSSESSPREVLTPNQKTIEQVSQFLKIKPQQMIKTLVFKADELFVVLCLAGDREVSEVKLGHLVTADVIRMAGDDEVMELTGVPVGYLGPVGLEARIRTRNDKVPFKIFYDRSVLEIGEAATGANLADHHLTHVDLARDLGITEESNLSLCDISSVRSGDGCPTCTGGVLNLIRGIEVGHIFKLGDRYSKPMKVNYLDKNGKDQHTIMGTYGIGVGRTMASSVEQNHDDKGIIWPRAIAPYEVCVISLDETDEIFGICNNLLSSFQEHKIDAIWDDRDERAGIKFNDADLVGYPLQIILGKRALEKGQIEYKIRKSGEKGFLPVEASIEAWKEILKSL